MLSIVVLDTLRSDELNISSILKDAYGKRELPIKRLMLFSSIPSLRKSEDVFTRPQNVFLASFNNMQDDYLDVAKELRTKNNIFFTVFVVSKRIDISLIIKPSAQLSGILFIPPDKIKLYQTINEVYAEYMKLSSKEESPIFTIKNGGEYYTIDTGEILFFEAQGKKIAARTNGQEISFYSNFDAVLEQLPEWFKRCHKGFVVNTAQIAHVSFTEMSLTLKDKSVIPLSRTYKNNIREFLEPRGADGKI